MRNIQTESKPQQVIAQRMTCFLEILDHPSLRQQRKGRDRQRPLMICPNCQKPMPHGNTKTCSAKCDRDQHWVKLVCPVCLKLFERKQSYVLKAIKKGQKDFYCGSSCVGKVGGRQHGWGKLKGERETEQMLFTNGCSRHQDCFTCPFPDCTVEDKEINKKAVESRHELVRELAQKGKCLAEIAMETHYEQSHVRRILRKETR